jgi:hypothetical protein
MIFFQSSFKSNTDNLSVINLDSSIIFVSSISFILSIKLSFNGKTESILTLEDDGVIVSVEEVELVGEVGVPQDSLTFSFKSSKLGEVIRVLSLNSISGDAGLELIGKLVLGEFIFIFYIYFYLDIRI